MFVDWLFLTLPYANTQVFIFNLILIGFCVGVISSFLGIGGAWMVTPALNILGFPMPYAVGTDIMHVGAKAMIATIQHSKRKNVDFKLGLLMLLGTIVGIEMGAQSVMYLERENLAGPVLRWIYSVFLFLIATVMLYDQTSKSKGFTGLKKIRKISFPPIIHFGVSNITCSAWSPIIIGIFTGYLAGLLGIGGGLLRLPALIYLLGCPTLIAVGTDLFEVMISGCYGGISYALKGRVDILAATYMFIGAIFGTKIGVLSVQHVSDSKIKSRFTFAVCGSFISIVLRQLSYPFLSKVSLFLTVGLLAISILTIFFRNKIHKLSGRA